MDTILDSQVATQRNNNQDMDLRPNNILAVEVEGAARVRVDWRLVVAYLATGVVALMLL